MASAAPDTGPIMLDGVPLRIRLVRAERMRKVRAMALILPLFLFLMITFAAPIVAMLLRSVQNPEIGQVLPRTSARMQLWDGNAFPPHDAIRTLAEEVVGAKQAKTLGKAAKRLNYHISGYRSLMFKTARRLERAIGKEGEEAVFGDAALLDRFIGIDRRWGERRYWSVITHAAPPHTAWYLLRSVDRDYDADARIVPVEVKSGAAGAMKSLHQFMLDKDLQAAVRLDRNPPSLQRVDVKTTQGRRVRYRLLNLPHYLTWRLPQLIAQTR